MDAENVHGRILIGVDRGGGGPDFFDGIKTREKKLPTLDFEYTHT
jgi:hypothetical protein